MGKLFRGSKMIKKRIGIYLDLEPYGGGSFQYVQSLLEALDSLDKDKYEVAVFYRQELWKKYLTPFSFSLQKAKAWNAKSNFFGRVYLRCLRLMKEDSVRCMRIFSSISSFAKQFDAAGLSLVIFPMQGAIFPALIKTRSVGVIHDLMHRYESFEEASGRGEYEAREFGFRTLCRGADVIFVDSEVGKRQVMESYGNDLAEKLAVLPFTPPKYLFQESSGEKSESPALPKKFFFYPAQFWKHKNHKNLLLALEKLKRQGFLDVHMVFVGSKKNGYEEVVQLIHERHLENNVTILGYVADAHMRILYQKARAMVMPTYFGPTNIPPLEAMAMGCPVAVSGRYAMPWQVQEAGLTFSPDRVDEIVEVLERLWTDDVLCRTLALKGKERAKYFSQEAFNERFQAAIFPLLG